MMFWMTNLISTFLVKVWFFLDVIIHISTFLIREPYSEYNYEYIKLNLIIFTCHIVI